MRFYESQCPECGQMAVLDDVCRACGHQPKPSDGDDDAPASRGDETPADEPQPPSHDFDVGAGG